jgi:hypothetical protein
VDLEVVGHWRDSGVEGTGPFDVGRPDREIISASFITERVSLPAPVALLVRPAETFEEATTYPRLAVVLVVGVALLTAASVAVAALPAMPTGGPLLLLGVPAVAAGVAVAAYARELLVRDARWDLIGIRGSRVGEPARWRVLVQQFVGVVAAAVALVVTGGVQVLL